METQTEKTQKKSRKRREFTKVRVQESKGGQLTITLPFNIAKNYLCVKKGDRVEYTMIEGKLVLSKVEDE